MENIELENNEMAQLLKQFTMDEPKDMQQTLTQLENDVTAIRSHLMEKKKKITMIQLDKKTQYNT